MPDDVGLAKRQRRERLRRDRRALPVRDVRAAGELLADRVFALPEFGSGPLAAYRSMPGEPSTDALLARCRARSVPVLLPVLLPDRDLDWVLYDATVLEQPRLGLDAVSTARVVVVPALAVDRSGQRLGQGGGSYDRALRRVSPAALVVALVHPGELVEGPLPVDGHDVAVDAVVTTAEVLRFTAWASGAAPATRRGQPLGH